MRLVIFSGLELDAFIGNAVAHVRGAAWFPGSAGRAFRHAVDTDIRTQLRLADPGTAPISPTRLTRQSAAATGDSAHLCRGTDCYTSAAALFSPRRANTHSIWTDLTA